MPYLGTSVDKVPGKIRRGQLPDPPGELMPRLEALREPVQFLCMLCWQRNPVERKTSAQLVHILRSVPLSHPSVPSGLNSSHRELIEGKSVPAILKEFESRENRRVPPIGGTNTRPIPPNGSISSSDTSESGSLEVNSVASPSETSDSGYETVTGNRKEMLITSYALSSLFF